nr:hypothetical protein [Thalassobius sp. I31.1]
MTCKLSQKSKIVAFDLRQLIHNVPGRFIIPKDICDGCPPVTMQMGAPQRTPKDFFDAKRPFFVQGVGWSGPKGNRFLLQKTNFQIPKIGRMCEITDDNIKFTQPEIVQWVFGGAHLNQGPELRMLLQYFRQKWCQDCATCQRPVPDVEVRRASLPKFVYPCLELAACKMQRI